MQVASIETRAPSAKTMAGPTIAVEAVSKRYGSATVLTDVSVSGYAGTVHAITGENGAGKSTLMKIFSGAVAPSSGKMLFQGKPVHFSKPRDARSAGVSTVFQEFTLLPNLSVAENLFLGREPGSAIWTASADMRRQAEEIFHRIGVEIDPDRLVRRLSVSQQQVVEIAKGLAADASVFIFDEPSAALNEKEVQKLEAIILDLKARGKTIFYISHRLDEIFDLCDTVTVLKDGKHITTCPCADLDHNKLVTLMVGRPVGDLFPAISPPKESIALDCRALTVGAASAPVNLTLRRGEIVGLAGLDGQGQREIMRALAGVIPPKTSQIVKFDRAGAETPLAPALGVRACVRHGLALVPGDRKQEGLYLELSIAQNITIGTFRGRRLLALAPAAKAVVQGLAQQLGLRAQSTKQAVGALSGGNQQKVLLARALAAGIDTLLVEEPTRGVDVGAKAEIYKLLRDFVDEGGAILVSSSELTELIGLCNRILVVRQGQIVAEVPASEATEERIMAHALGSEGSIAGSIV
jgi:ribose transport system ATP-binding protein